MTGKIATDRPGFSDTASLVPRGRIQIESGYTFTYDREHDRRVIDHNYPELALRTGLTDWLEFRALWIGYSSTEVLDKITTPAGRHINHEDHEDDDQAGAATTATADELRDGVGHVRDDAGEDDQR